MAQGQLIGAALVAGVHGLRRTQYIGDLLLRFVVILSQVAQPALVCQTAPTPLGSILHSKYIYY